MMVIALWIASALLTLSNLGAGAFKLVTPRSRLVAMQPWTNDFTATQIRLIAIAEVLGGLGVILPLVTNILPVVASIAAFAIAALQVGALVTHVRRSELVVPNLVIIAIALFVGIGWLVVGR
jgi:hypothetical protein